MRKEKKLHILISTWAYPEYHSKGNPFVEDQAEALAKRGIRVGVMLFNYLNILSFFKKIFLFSPLHNYKKNEHFKVFTATYVNIIPPGFANIRKKLIQWNASIFFLRYMFYNGKPDLIHQHYIINGPAQIVQYLSGKFNIPYVLTEHSAVQTLNINDERYNKENILRFSRNAAFRIAVSETYRKIYETCYQCEFERIPNLVPDIFFKNKINTEKINNQFTFLNVANLVNVKNQIRLIHSFVKAFQKQDRVILKIAGNGPLAPLLKSEIVKQGMENNIFLLGELTRDKIIELMDNSSAMVLSSNRETFNVSIAEGMSRGLPVVSTKCGGPEEFVNENNGVLAEQTVDDLAEKMKWMFNNYSKFSPVTISEMIRIKFSEEIVTEKLIGLYNLTIKA